MIRREANKIYLSIKYGIALMLLLSGCKGKKDEEVKQPLQHEAVKGTYGYDLAFMKDHSKNFLELISADSSARVLLSPQWQGRVMTSSAMGDTGTSFGWLNYELLKSGEKRKQFNPIGGEERFWIGPEGGQYSVYFQKGDSFTIGHWQVPAIIDTIPYEVVQSQPSSATFKTKAKLTNYSGTQFDFDIERRVDLVNKDGLEQQLGISIPNPIHFVGYKTKNTLINTGNEDWNKKNGLLSIWLLGMFTPTPQTFVIIPFHPVANARSMITDNYFGTVPPERLRVSDSILYFTCDGKLRSKIGISPAIAKTIAGSFDFANNVLTLIIPEVQSAAAYVNSKWEFQKDPYKGDVINSYNDGPLADGTQLGPFYEIESSSPALELAKGKTGSYAQTTCHLQGDYEKLKSIAKQILGVDLDTLKP
jgi:hypothetical protein